MLTLCVSGKLDCHGGVGQGWGANNTMHNNTVNYNRIERSNTKLFEYVFISLCALRCPACAPARTTLLFDSNGTASAATSAAWQIACIRILAFHTKLSVLLRSCGSIYTLSNQPDSEVAYNYISNQVLLFGSLYHDARSGGFHTHHNVVVGGPMWLVSCCHFNEFGAASSRHVVAQTKSKWCPSSTSNGEL